jgi:periplasmic protein TonB
MKRSLLTLAFISLCNSLALAQQSAAILTDTSCQASGAQQINSEACDEYVPLNNTPFFPGGQKALMAYFIYPAPYPYSARVHDTEGTVQVHFRV